MKNCSSGETAKPERSPSSIVSRFLRNENLPEVVSSFQTDNSDPSSLRITLYIVRPSEDQARCRPLEPFSGSGNRAVNAPVNAEKVDMLSVLSVRSIWATVNELGDNTGSLRALFESSASFVPSVNIVRSVRVIAEMKKILDPSFDIPIGKPPCSVATIFRSVPSGRIDHIS